jgi:hypothetical protein
MKSPARRRVQDLCVVLVNQGCGEVMDEIVPLTSKHKPLVFTWLFWLAVLLPVVLGMVLGLFIGFSSELGSLCFRADCVQVFFNTFKFPIAIMGLALPLVAMVAAIHRSNEAALQIKITSAQYGEAIVNNRFGNYLKHREGFEKLIGSYCANSVHGSECKIEVRMGSLYGRLFPESGFNNVRWTGQCDASRLELGVMCAKIIMHEAKAAKEEFNCYALIKSIDALLRLFQINYYPCKSVSVDSEEEGGSVTAVIPGYDSVPKSLVYAASDCFSILALFRSYVGVNNSDDLDLRGCIESLYDNVRWELSKQEFEG